MSTTSTTRTLPEGFRLAVGAHIDWAAGACMVEAAAYLAGERPNDQPQCVSPVIAAFCRAWNDALDDDDRDRLLLPYVSQIIGTRTTDADEETRGWLALDWLVRVHTPAWLRLAGLDYYADSLASLPRITDATLAVQAAPKIDAARRASATTRTAARTAMWAEESAAGSAAANAAAMSATSGAARAAGAAADAAANAAASAAASVAGRVAARNHLRPTVEALQLSALGLLASMIAVGRAEQ